MKRQQKLVLFIVLLPLLCTQVFSQQNISKSPTGPLLLLSPKPLYFGQIPVGSTAERNLLVYNIGDQAANITDISIQGLNAANFAIQAESGSRALSPLEFLVLNLRFQPSTTGSRFASIVVKSNASTLSDSLRGAGTDVSSGAITFERIFGGTEFDGASALRRTTDGGYVIVGQTFHPDDDFPDAYVVKTDRFGEIQWTSIFGEPDEDDGANSVVATKRGNFIIAGTSVLLEGAYIRSLDASGNTIWDNTFENGGTISSIDSTSDGGYILGGRNSLQGKGRDATLVKLDSTGKEVWFKNFGGSGGEAAYDVHQTSDGGYILAGSTTSSGAGEFDVYLVKTDAAGTLQWQKTYGGVNWEEAYSVQQTTDGGYVLAGYTASFGAGARDVYLLKTDAGGNLLWSKTFGDIHSDDAAVVKQAKDGGYIIAASTINFVTTDKQYSDLYIIKTDGNGNLQWSKTFGDAKNDQAIDLQLADDGGIVVVGNTDSYSKNGDIFFIKLNADGLVTAAPDKQGMQPRSFLLAQNFPNPFNNTTVIQYRLQHRSHVSLVVYNVAGQKVKTLVNDSQHAGLYSVQFDGSDLSSGLFFYELKTDDQREIRRMLLLK